MNPHPVCPLHLDFVKNKKKYPFKIDPSKCCELITKNHRCKGEGCSYSEEGQEELRP